MSKSQLMNNLIYKIKRFFTLSPPKNTVTRHSLVGKSELWEMKRNFQIRFLKEAGLEPHHHFLDIGCGTLRGGIPVIEYLHPRHYLGIDAREEAIQEARKELQDARLVHKKPAIRLVKNIADLNLSSRFDFIWAFSVLFHMTDEILQDTLKLVSSCITNNGRFYANIHIGNCADGSWREFPVVYRSLEFYRKACLQCDLTVRDLGRLQENGHISGIADQDEQTMLEIKKRQD